MLPTHEISFVRGLEKKKKILHLKLPIPFIFNGKKAPPIDEFGW